MKRAFLILTAIFAFSIFVSAQTTAFNFQGRLNDGSSPANGRYDLEFRLYDAVAGGNQIGATLSRVNSLLVNGVFSTQLDFGAASFDGGNRFIEIGLRATGSGNAFVILGPRQQILSVPYTIRSARTTLADEATHAANADNLGGVTSDGFVQNRSFSQSTQIGGFNLNGGGSLGGNFSVGGRSFFTGDGSFSGRVGIGTSLPQAKLHVMDSGSVEARITSSNERAILALESNLGGQSKVWTVESGVNGNAGLFGIFNRTTGLKLSISENGVVGVNTLQITGGSDLAEKFEFSETVKPGMVVAIDEKNAGKLSVARGAYNRRVAGIVSGANDLAAGMILPNLKETGEAQPVALSGRVWVYADATKNPISAGDLLTTSDTAGYAMKIKDYKRAAGATIGKAMTELKSGKGLVLVLVSLQ